MIGLSALDPSHSSFLGETSSQQARPSW